jgi:hypothetical protein
MNMTIFDRGREQGIVEGQRVAIRLLLEKKMGRLSEDKIQRLNAWPADRLAELLAIDKASSLAELGLADG